MKQITYLLILILMVSVVSASNINNKVIKVNGFDLVEEQINDILKLNYQNEVIKCEFSLYQHNINLKDYKTTKKLLRILEIDYEEKPVSINGEEFAKIADKSYGLLSNDLAVISNNYDETCLKILLLYEERNPSQLSIALNTIIEFKKNNDELIPESKQINKDAGFFNFIKSFLSKIREFTVNKLIKKPTKQDLEDMEELRKEKYGETI